MANSKLTTIFQVLRNRPGMLISGSNWSYKTYVIFLEGFITGFNIYNQDGIERKISQWYQNKVEIKAPNMTWFGYFELVNSEKSEDDKIALLLDTLEEFFADLG